MPVVGMAGSADFSNYFLPLSSGNTGTTLLEAQKFGPVLAWGSFITYVVNFIIVALALFAIVKLLDRAKRRMAFDPPKTVAPSRQEVLLTDIRDLLALEHPAH